MKYLRVRFSNGEEYDIPAEFIARERAEYYVTRDIDRGDTKEEDCKKEIQAEIEFALKDDSEIVDWAFNNMDWEDVKEVAQKVEVEPEKINYEREWCNIDHDIIEK